MQAHQQDCLAALAKAPVFRTLPADTLGALVSAGTEIHINTGVLLFDVGDESHGIYVIVTGEIEINFSTVHGDEMPIAYLMPGEILGEMSVLLGAAHSAKACARKNTQLLRIGRSAVLDFLSKNPDAAIALLRELAHRLHETDTLLQRVFRQDLGKRLARFLLQTTDHGRYPVTFSQAEIARRIGASREKVNRKLADWRAHGWIDITDSGLKLTSGNQLELLLENMPD